MNITKLIKTIDYFTPAEITQAEEFLIQTKALVTRSQLFKEMLTKPRMESKRDLGLLTTYYSKRLLTKDALNALPNKLSYYTVVTPHSFKEIRQAKELILNYRDADIKLSLPAICLVIIPDYYPINKFSPIQELELINYAALETLTFLTK